MVDLVRIKDKFQVTIPVSLRRQLEVHEDDYLEASVSDNGIVLRPQKLGRAAAPAKGLVSFLMEPRTSRRTRADIDAALAADRDSWTP